MLSPRTDIIVFGSLTLFINSFIPNPLPHTIEFLFVKKLSMDPVPNRILSPIFFGTIFVFMIFIYIWCNHITKIIAICCMSIT